MAVIESPVEPAALQRVMAGPAAAALPDGVFQGAVDRLARRHLARRDIGASGRLRLRIDHVKIREHVYDGMDWQERRALHGRIGEALEKEGRAGVEELAHHFVHSADPVKALDYAERAGLHALSLFATERSVAFLERALDLVPPSDPERRLTLQLSLGDAYRQGRDHARAIETYDKVIKGSRVSGHKDLHWKASAHLLDVLARVGQHDEAQRSAERLIPTLRAEGARGHLAMVLTTLGSSMGAQGRLQESRELNEEALALRRELRDLPGMAANLNNLGLIDLLTETSEQGLALLEESLSLRRRIGDEQHACEALQNIGWWHRRRGAMAAAAGSTEEAAAMARRNHDRWMLAVTETSLAAIYQTQGRLDAALKAARRAVADAQSIGDEERECEALDFLGMIQRDLGDLAGAVGSHERAVSTARRAGLPSQEVYAAASLALDRLASAPSPQDVRSVRDALRRAARAAVSIQSPKLQSRLHEAAARTHLAAGDPAQALSFARLALESASAARLASAQAGAELLVAECLAAAQPEGAPAEAIECARRAAEIAIASDLPEPRWQAHALLSSLHQREGRRIPEREELGRAAAVLQRVSDGIEDEQVRLAYLAEPRRADVMRRAGALSRRTIAPRQGEREDASPERVLAAMFELSDIISSQSDLDTMLDRLLDVGLGIVGAERGLIILLDEKTGEQRVTAARDLEEETVRDALEYSHSVVQDAAAGQVLVTLDARQDDRFRKYKSVNLYAIKSLMCVPMRSRDRVIGTVYVDSRRRGIPFNQQDLRFLEAFGNLAGSAVELSRLHERLASENTYLRQEAVGRHRFQNLIGKNVKMQAVYDLMEKVASSNLPVLIQGESGTGKELVARALHYSGPRRSRKFYCENVAAIPDTLLESAMFGHVRGAFTGADRDHKGLFELADGGTLFLDEIGDMSLPLQSKVLRALQEGEIRPVGGKEFRKVDVRIISATNKDLEQLMKERRFREDLYFRLNVVRIALPPLRERKEDIPLLVDHFLHKAARDTGAPPKKIEMGALQLLLRYSWPGNVRELENEIQRLAVLCAGEVITQNEVMQSGELFEKITRLEEKDAFTPLEELERRQIEKALLEAAGNRARAAELLGISRATIFRKLRKFNISH
ncbi:MAG TPA: sigma 54-interacting transcriptional regulator [Candidatus Polarisedimenticolia bacterium]|nr:sigma 54-interacting transcriptional regulator [Candidatus Polarisedimenticolia bacterium]